MVWPCDRCASASCHGGSSSHSVRRVPSSGEGLTFADARRGDQVVFFADLFAKLPKKGTPFPVRWLPGGPTSTVELVNTQPGSSDLSILVAGTLDSDWMAALSDLVASATEIDGTSPLSEQAILNIRGGSASANHVLAVDGRHQLVGYAFIDRGDRSPNSTAQLVVHPDARCRGIGRRLVAAAAKVAQPAGLLLWARGDHPGAAVMAAQSGARRVRDLWQMRRPTDLPLPEVAIPEGITIRVFEPGVDESAWLAVNGRAFADHPEQGAMTRSDLEARMAEPWFDPKGFFIAERAGQMVGFHWTKVHGTGTEAIGEVYVLGVDPAAQGLGLGTVLTLVGLRHLASLGLSTVMLYVEADNAPAIKVYERLGFVHHSTDVMYLREP
jgi:mycothiol synthase